MEWALLTLAFLITAYVAGVLVGRWSRTWRQCVTLSATGWLWGGIALASPQEALGICLADAKTLAPKVAYSQRYLDLTHLSPEDRRGWFGVLSFHLNSLSRERAIVRPRSLADGKVLAFNLADYRIDPFVYFRLEDADVYFHVRIEEQGKRKNVHAPWLDNASAKELQALCQSSTAILRGDWFFAQTIVQADRKAGYYDMLGLGKHQKDFDELIGADVKTAEKLRLDVIAMVARSGVTLNNRSITRVPSLTGGYWITDDFKTSVDKQNTLRLFKPDYEPPHGDASERYGVLPNGLFAYWLQDAKGARQDVAPDFIASDAQAPGTDRRVHVGVSCIRCHVEGLRPIDDYARNLYRGTVKLASPVYEKFVRYRGQYLSDLERELTRDRLVFAQAVRDCNGWTVTANATAVASAWESYVEHSLTPADAARELGCSEGEFMTKLRAYAKQDGLIDPVIAGFLKTEPQPAPLPPKPSPLPMRREHFEEVVPQLMKAIGAVP